MALTTPPWSPQTIPAFPAGYQASPTTFNSLVQQSIGWLCNRLMFRAVLAGAQTITVNTNTVVNYDTVQEDPYGGWNAGTFTWNPPFTGWYEIVTNMTNSGTNCFLTRGFILNGLGYFTATSDVDTGGIQGGGSGTYAIQLGPGDALQGFVYSGSVGCTTSTTYQPSMEIFFMSQ